MIRSKPNRLAVGLCLYFAVLACLYAAVTPAFESPDEASHFLYAHNLLETGQLPVLQDRATVFKSQSTQRHHPPLYYLIGALLISGTNRADLPAYLHANPLASIGVAADNNLNVYLHPLPTPSGDTAVAVWILRLYSIALGTATVWLVYRCAGWVTGDAHTALLAMLLVISIPTFIHISASINNDNLVTLLFTAGIYVCLKTWHRRQISARDIAFSGLILSAVALTKINGLTLFGIMYGWVAFGAFKKRYPWRQALLLVAASLVMAALLAGWWYVRNVQLYGDPLAMKATLEIWGRGGPPHLVSLPEAQSIWESFWFTLGYFNIRGPNWLYDLYLPLVTVLAVGGLIKVIRHGQPARPLLLFMLGIALLAVLTLLAATSRIDVSQGRILFPGIAAFAILFASGWSRLLGRKAGGLLVVPLAVLAVVTPLVYLAPAFAPAHIVNTLPASAQPVNISTDGLTVLGYENLTDTLQADRWVKLTLYLRGSAADDPYLFVKALYPLNQDVLGGVDEYPGMMPTQAMQSDLIYAVPVRFRLDEAKLSRYPPPYQIQLVFGWRALTADHKPGGAFLPLRQSDGSPIKTPILDGPIVANAASAPPAQHPVNVVYGGKIRLSGYTLSADRLLPGQKLTVRLDWQEVSPINEDWTVAIGLLDSAGQPLTLADGAPAGYPTSAWRPGLSFTDTRTLLIPPQAAPGDYSLYIGWYRESDGVRLQPVGNDTRNDLFFHPQAIVVCADASCLK